MTTRINGIDRQVEVVNVTLTGLRTLKLSGPKVQFFALEKACQPGAFVLMNSRGRVIGGLVERNGNLVEAG